MLFQALDDKQECIGIYCEGQLHFEEFPNNLTHSWKYTPSLADTDIEYGWLYATGQSLTEVCPDDLTEDLRRSQKRLQAYLKSFQLAKVNMRDHCIFDLVPRDFLKEFCEIKNKITADVLRLMSAPPITIIYDK